MKHRILLMVLMSGALLAQADRCVTIPMHGPIESLNVSVAAALVLYEVVRRAQL